MIRKKVIRKVLIGSMMIFVFIIGAGTIFSIVYKDEIISYFLDEANKHIKTPIDVGEINVSIFNHFPNISINLKDVTIMESSNNNVGVLGKAKRISVSFSPIDIIRKNYVVKGLHLSEADVNILIDKNGIPNYLFYEIDTTSKGTKFSLQNITGDKLNINYLDQKSGYHVAVYIKKANAQLTQTGKMMKLSVNGDLITDEIKVGDRIFFNNKVIELETEFDLDLKNKVYDFHSGNIKVDNGEFDVSGGIDAINRNINLAVKGVNTTFQSINSLLSNDLSKYLKAYDSKGAVYFLSSINGNYSDNASPQITVEFGAKNASFFHRKFKKQIKNVNLNGHFATSKINKSSNYKLSLNNFSCKLEDKMLEGSMTLQNFKDYKIDLTLKGEADVNTLLLLFPEKYVKTAFGNIEMDIRLKGKLKNPKLSENLDASGEIKLKNVSFVLTGEKLPFNRINGSLMMNNNDLAINELSGNVGNSDFLLNGYVKDLSDILLSKDKVYKMQADLYSHHIDFDELLKSNFASRDTTKNTTYEFKISPKISLDFNCEIDQLNFKRFYGRNIKGRIEIKQQIAILKNVYLSSMGGKINISGSVNSKRENKIETISEANLSGINVDSIFYVFNNFNQDWLIDENLKGQLKAEINLYMNFNNNLELNDESMVADIQTTISNGELNNFEPMMKLSKFVEEESLAHMRFSHITNEIRVKNRTIYLPEMEIRSNVSNIIVSGTHTFDKDIEYHLRVPLKSFIRISKKKGYNKSAREGMSLLLKITGNTSDYSISYDTKTLINNIKSDLLDEGKEWKKIKNNDFLPVEEVPELEEEYFEFDDGEDGTDN